MVWIVKCYQGTKRSILDVWLGSEYSPPSSSVVDNKYMTKYNHEESHLREENVRLQRKLLLEMERREQLSRQLSESESSLEMDDER